MDSEKTKQAKPLPERSETDSSLRAERDSTDERLAKRRSDVEDVADQIVKLARGRADATLESARRTADAMLGTVEGPTGRASAMSRARTSEDEAVKEERGTADDNLEAERAGQARGRAGPLTVERAVTDERLLAERALSDHAVASRDEFLAIVSHDARQMLASMALSADMLLLAPKTRDAAGQRIQQEARRIRRLLTRMDQLIEDLLDVVSMESGKLSVAVAEHDASRLLDEALETFQPIAESRAIRMTSESSREQIHWVFDYDRILQVLANLVGNALKFTPAGGSIALCLTELEGGIQFTVRDSGSGIAADKVEVIFERFRQGGEKDRRGLGLGLYIARSIIDAHGGKIWAESKAGEGSAFHFTLPAVDRATAAPSRAREDGR